MILTICCFCVYFGFNGSVVLAMMRDKGVNDGKNILMALFFALPIFAIFIVMIWVIRYFASAEREEAIC